MARIESLNVLLTTTGNDYLAEEYGKVIANVQQNTISAKMKNMDLSGNAGAGTLEAKRFENRTSKSYGTARSGGAGQAVKAKPVVVAIDTDKELITEIESKDVSLYGVDNFIERQAQMDQRSMTRELERAFFSTAKTAGTQDQLTGITDDVEKLEKLIQDVETVSNNFVDGVPRDMIHVALSPSFYGKVRTYIDKVTDGGAKEAEVGLFHGVKVYSSVYLPASTNAIAMCEGAVAQPVLPTVAPAQRIPLSNAIATGLFYSYGTKAVAEDLIFWA